MEDDTICAVANFQLDHKYVHKAQGDTLGILVRLTWLDKNKQFNGFNIFLSLEECDKFIGEKTCEATAHKLYDFLSKKMNLLDHMSKVTFTSDHAIYEGIEKYLNQLGIKNLANKFVICAAHNVMNVFKVTESEVNLNIEKEDATDGKSYLTLFFALLMMILVWCMSDSRTKTFILNEKLYNEVWAKCNTNCKRGIKTNLNKEMGREYRQMSQADKDAIIERLLDYQQKMYDNTDHKLSTEAYDRKKKWYQKHGFQTQFTRTSDHKFRHSTTKWAFFHANLPLIQAALNKHPQLKEYIYGAENMDFKFDPDYIEAKSELMQYHQLQVTRVERNENINFNSSWDTWEQIMTYALSSDDAKQPIRDPFRM